MVNSYAKLAGLLLVLVGLLGGIPLFVPNHLLFGIFSVNPVHNIFHMATGLVFLAVGFNAHGEVARRTVLFLAAFYGTLTVLGFLDPQGMVFGMPLNMAANVLHLTVTATGLVLALPARSYPMRY